MRSSQRVVITGAAGKIGRSFTRVCVNAGISVLAIIRPGQNISDIVSDKSDILVMNLDEDLQFLANKLTSSDCVVHLAASMTGLDRYGNTLAATDNLLKAMELAGVKHLMLLSSISVLDYCAVQEGTLIDEGSAVCSQDDYLGEYARMKRDQEVMTNQWASVGRAARCVVLRAGLVYEDGVISADHAGLTLANKTICVSHVGQVPVIHIRSLCAALQSTLMLFDKTEQQFEILHLIDNQTLTQTEYIEKLIESRTITRVAEVSWKNYRRLTRLLARIMTSLGMSARIPDQLRQNSVAGRNAPFKFSNKAARESLNWPAES